MISTCRILLLFGICVTPLISQVVEDDVFHFTNSAQGNAVWILDESALPWTGGYKYLRSLFGLPTTLLSIVDSSTGATLGQCVAPETSTNQNQTKHWESFHWELTKQGLSCVYETSSTPAHVQFKDTPNPRTFSIRIQSVTGPACLRNLNVQNEQPVGCPPHLSKNSFTAINFNCTCPYLDVATNEDEENENEDVDMLANSPQFPIFKGIEPAPFQTTSWTLSPSPCAGHECFNNGTCLVSQEGAATCLCRNGFAGDQCELDICQKVPCQNGGVCRSKNGHAVCDCLPRFTGLLCQATIEDEITPDSVNHPAVIQCTPECSNGDCVLNASNSKGKCECRQGFTGSNCNVLDVCLGDAACSMFGQNAKCVLDDNMDKTESSILINGTYDCLCPHPINGQFVDCMQLHAPAASSVQPFEASKSSTPSFPVLETSQLTNSGSTSAVVPIVSTATTQQRGSISTQTNGFTVTREPMRPVEITFGTTLPPPFHQRIITAGDIDLEKPKTTNNLPSQTQTTFVFPQTPETTTIVATTSTTVMKFISPNKPSSSSHKEDGEHKEEKSDEEAHEFFPTPNTMNIGPQQHFETTTDIIETSEKSLETTTEMDEDEDEDFTTEEDTTVALTVSPEQISTTMSTSTLFENGSSTTNEQTGEESDDDESDEQSEETPQTQKNLPFWMTGSTNIAETTTEALATKTNILTHEVVPDEPRDDLIASTERTHETEDVDEDEKSTAISVDSRPTTHESSNEVVGTRNMELTTPSDVVHHHTVSGKQSNAAASWIIAISAVIALGLLLLALSLIILRYIRQSRKLHGKYNPAREEHNLSAAYAMPMSHITKEERLI